MNLKKLTTLLFAGVTAATPFATNAQNPTILQGNYISNVFGQANFVLNPNAQTNVANVTLTNATATRSTTTPLVATSEWNVTVTSANGTAAWATRSFDEGMKNQNCEARFSYRGFQATSKAQIKQGANVVAELTLTPSATDPRIASINFPCGDLSAATTFVITDSATLLGTNEIGGIYVGLATNMANVAQAELVVSAYRSGTQSVPNVFSTPYVFNNELKDLHNEFDTSNGRFSPKRAGDYLVTSAVLFNNNTWAAGKYYEITLRVGGSARCRVYKEVQAAATMYLENQITCVISMVPGQYLETYVEHDFGSTIDTNPGGIYSYNYTYITRLPSSSELVVTPETQNVWAAAKWTGGSGTTITTNSTAAVGSGFTGYTAYGKASTSAPTSMEMTVANIPPGAYKLTANVQLVTLATSATNDCYIKVSDDNGSTYQVTQGSTQTYTSAFAYAQNVGGSTFFNYTSVQPSKTFKVYIEKAGSGTGECRAQYISENTNIILEPLDNASNSALYVQGPVKAAGTGTAIPAGYVGEEKIGYATSTSTVSANSEVDVTNASITLEPGVWDIEYSASVLAERTPASTTSVQCRLRIRDSANNVETLTESGIGLFSNTSDLSWNFFEMSKKKRLTLTSTKTYKLSLTASVANTVANCIAYTGTTAGAISGNEATTYIRAIRIN